VVRPSDLSLGGTEPFVSRQQVHFDMLDRLGVLHNAVYLLLFERARTEFWHSRGVGYGLPGLDWPYLVVRNEVNYRNAIVHEQEITVTVAVRDLGLTSVAFAHEVRDSTGRLCADGATVIVRVDAETRRPVPWSAAFRELIRPIHLASAPDG